MLPLNIKKNLMDSKLIRFLFLKWKELYCNDLCVSLWLKISWIPWWYSLWYSKISIDSVVWATVCYWQQSGFFLHLFRCFHATSVFSYLKPKEQRLKLIICSEITLIAIYLSNSPLLLLQSSLDMTSVKNFQRMTLGMYILSDTWETNKKDLTMSPFSLSSQWV